MGQLSAFVYSERLENADWAWETVKLYRPVGSVRMAVQFAIAAISPVVCHHQLPYQFTIREEGEER